MLTPEQELQASRLSNKSADDQVTGALKVTVFGRIIRFTQDSRDESVTVAQVQDQLGGMNWFITDAEMLPEVDEKTGIKTEGKFECLYNGTQAELEALKAGLNEIGQNRNASMQLYKPYTAEEYTQVHSGFEVVVGKRIARPLKQLPIENRLARLAGRKINNQKAYVQRTGGMVPRADAATASALANSGI